MKDYLVSMAPSNKEMKDSAGITYAIIALAFAIVAVVGVVIIVAPNAAVERFIQFIGVIIPTVLGFVFVGGKVTSLINNSEKHTEDIQAIPVVLEDRITKLETSLAKQVEVMTGLPCISDNGVPGTEEEVK